MNENLDCQKKYASVEQPWKLYQRKELIREFDVHQPFSKLIEGANSNNLNSTAISFMGFKGNSWTYDEFFTLGYQLANAYKRDGVKEGTHVLIATVSGMEEALNLFALNLLGATSKWIDITASERELEEAINKNHCETVVVFAPVVPELQKIINDTDVKKVLYVEPSQYMRPLKVLSKSLQDFKKMKKLADESAKNPLPSMPDDPRYMPFKNYVKSGEKSRVIIPSYDKERPVLKIQSSGTTGKPKVIVHTDYTINNSIRKFSGTDLPLYSGYVLLKTAPAWVGYGLINTLGVGLAYGMNVLMTPMLGDDILFNYNEMYDVVFGVPLHYRYLDTHFDEIKSMSRPKVLASGGDKISKEEIVKFQEKFSTKGCVASIVNGAGNNEVLGAGVVNPAFANRPGSIGIPMYDEMISIFDPDTMEEMPIGEIGEVCYKTESAFLCYEDNPELTNDVKRLHPDGSVWIHSKDLGYQDADGFVYFKGRLSRVITVGAFKISASQIEDVVQSYPAVKECIAVAVPDKIKGEVPMVHIVLYDEYKEEENAVIEEIRELCNSSLKEKAAPKYYNIIDSMPYTSNNKQDFRKLEELGRKIVASQKEMQKVYVK